MFPLTSVLALLLTFSVASPTRRGLVLRESRSSIPSGFVKNGPASSGTVLELRVGLFSSDIAGLEKALFDVSTPGSDLHGQHLSKEEVEKFVMPTSETTQAVNTFLTANGLEANSASPAGDWLSLSIPVSKANDIFGADFQVFTHQATGQQFIRTMSYSVPSELESAIELVHPTVMLADPSIQLPVVSTPLTSQIQRAGNLSSDAVPASCATTVTPACLQALYGIPTAKATQSSNVLGVSGFIDQFAQTADLKSFLTAFRPDLPSTTTFALQTLDGGSNPQGANDAGIEANLDTQMTVGIASGVPTTFISVGDNTKDGVFGFMDIITALLAESAPPHVLTTSYGSNEADVSSAVAQRLCTAYMQLGARGTSILFSSGDGGVSGTQAGSCSTSFVPTFPSGCPFMTSVGATTGIAPETAASFSSGGFSNVFAQPSYQTSAVTTYLNALGNTNSGKFNRAGRAFPDISAQGENVVIVDAGTQEKVAGTSCSSPIFAAVVALLNDELIAAGKAPLGFLNPFLYANPQAFNDVTTGSNPGCGTNGFPARTGWDPVTGLGTPNFAALRTAAGL